MAGRKPALPASLLIDAVLKFKDKIISTNDKGKKGGFEPAIIPTGNCLDTLKSKKLVNERRNKDSLISLNLMKTENEFMHIIQDIGCDPFFVHYHSSEQINLYRSYCSITNYPKLVIDATGSIVKTFNRFDLEKTKSIYLYEALVYNKEKKKNFTVTNMLSERHTNIAISNWLLKWISCDVKKPKETICDNSLALLSSIVQSFTQYSSLNDYVGVFSDLLTQEMSSTSHWVPRCFVRIDVAHFVKICCKWTPLKTVSRRIRENVLRLVGILIKCQSLTEVRYLLFSMFVVFTNETDGINLVNGQETPCELHKRKLIEATSSGFIEFQQEFDNIIAHAESVDEARNLTLHQSRVLLL